MKKLARTLALLVAALPSAAEAQGAPNDCVVVEQLEEEGRWRLELLNTCSETFFVTLVRRLENAGQIEISERRGWPLRGDQTFRLRIAIDPAEPVCSSLLQEGEDSWALDLRDCLRRVNLSWSEQFFNGSAIGLANGYVNWSIQEHAVGSTTVTWARIGEGGG